MRLALCVVSMVAFGWMVAPVLADPQAPVDVDAIHKQFAAKDAAITDLKEQLADRDKQLSELRNAPNAKRARSDAAAKDAMIADLRSQLAAWQVWAGKVNAQIKDLQDTINTLRVDTKAKDARIGVLEEDVTQRKQDLKDALSALAGSHQAAEPQIGAQVETGTGGAPSEAELRASLMATVKSNITQWEANSAKKDHHQAQRDPGPADAGWPDPFPTWNRSGPWKYTATDYDIEKTNSVTSPYTAKVAMRMEWMGTGYDFNTKEAAEAAPEVPKVLNSVDNYTLHNGKWVLSYLLKE